MFNKYFLPNLKLFKNFHARKLLHFLPTHKSYLTKNVNFNNIFLTLSIKLFLKRYQNSFTNKLIILRNSLWLTRKCSMWTSYNYLLVWYKQPWQDNQYYKSGSVVNSLSNYCIIFEYFFSPNVTRNCRWAGTVEFTVYIHRMLFAFVKCFKTFVYEMILSFIILKFSFILLIRIYFEDVMF